MLRDVVGNAEVDVARGAHEIVGHGVAAGRGRGRPHACEGLPDFALCVRPDPVGDVVEILVHVDDAGQWRHNFAFDVCVGNRLAGGVAAGHGDEVRLHDLTVHASVDAQDKLGNGDPVHRVQIFQVPTGVEHRLQHDAPYRRVLESELDNSGNFVLVHIPFNGRGKNSVDVVLIEDLERGHLLVQQRFAAQLQVRLFLEAVELQIDHRVEGAELIRPCRVFHKPPAVGIDHDMPDALVLGHLDEVQELRMDCWLATRKLDHFRITLRPHERIEHGLDFIRPKVVAGPSIHEAGGAGHVAACVHLDDHQAGVLLVFGAEAAIVRAAVLDFCRELKRYVAWLVITKLVQVAVGVWRDEDLEPAVVRTALAHDDLSIFEMDFGVDELFADRAHAPR